MCLTSIGGEKHKKIIIANVNSETIRNNTINK